MSAWIVSKKHIDVLVRGLLDAGAFRHGGKWISVVRDASEMGDTNAPFMTATEAGKMLWRENHKSVNYRYGEKTKVPAYTYSEPAEYLVPLKYSGGTGDGMRMNPGILAKQVSCYDYQTCEHSGYYSSKAYSALLTIARTLLHNVEGAEDAPWGV